MLKNFFITTLRVLYQNKGFSFINIMGLAIGFTCCIFIALYINHEIGYDRFHQNSERIFLLTRSSERNNEISERMPITTPKMGEDLMNYIPEVEKILRLGFTGGSFKIGKNTVSSGPLLYADSTLWDFLDFKLISGNPNSALKKPFSIVVSEELAYTMFGDQDPIGRIILQDGKTPFTVTGVVQDCPKNTRIKYNGFVSFTTLYNIRTGTMTEWDGNFSFRTLMLLSPDANPQEVARKANDFADAGINKKLAQANVRFIMGVQALRDIHLYNDLNYEKPGVAKTLYLFAAIALFILFIAGFNFVNLTTARSTRRAKEVGIRMTVGASKNLIRLQFLGESIILALVSTLISLLLVELLMPSYNNLLGLNLSLYNSSAIQIFSLIPLFVILFGLLAGLYPAFFLSSFKPIKVLKGDFGGVKSKPRIRNFLVSIQFMVSSLLIIATSTVFLQIKFLKNTDIGLNPDNLLAVSVMGEQKWERANRLELAFLSLPEVESVGISTEIPGYGFTQNGYVVEGLDDVIMIRALGANYNFLDAIETKFIAGRNFSETFQADINGAIVNETLVKKAGWTDPIGKKILRSNEKEFTVIGVVKDFHFKSLHSEIEPLIVFLPFGHYFWSNPKIHIRFREGLVKEGIDKVHKTWDSNELSPMLSYVFIKDVFNSQYRAEDNFGSLFIYFSILALFISCLGLLGLSSFMLENRRREIGIRKVMGSGIRAIVARFSIDFTRWALLGTIISWPVAWYFAKEWLTNFSYRIDIPWMFFMLAAIATFAVAVATILLQTYKAARTNPVETLKYE